MRVRSQLLMMMLVSLTALWGCGDDPEPAASAPASDASDSGDGAIGGGGSGDSTTPPVVATTWAAPDEAAAWRILFNYRGRMPTNSGENDLWLMDSWGSGKESLTDLSGLKFEDPPLSCNYGCVNSPALS